MLQAIFSCFYCLIQPPRAMSALTLSREGPAQAQSTMALSPRQTMAPATNFFNIFNIFRRLCATFESTVKCESSILNFPPIMFLSKSSNFLYHRKITFKTFNITRNHFLHALHNSFGRYFSNCLQLPFGILSNLSYDFLFQLSMSPCQTFNSGFVVIYKLTCNYRKYSKLPKANEKMPKCFVQKIHRPQPTLNPNRNSLSKLERTTCAGPTPSGSSASSETLHTNAKLRDDPRQRADGNGNMHQVQRHLSAR